MAGRAAVGRAEPGRAAADPATAGRAAVDRTEPGRADPRRARRFRAAPARTAFAPAARARTTPALAGSGHAGSPSVPKAAETRRVGRCRPLPPAVVSPAGAAAATAAQSPARSAAGHTEALASPERPRSTSPPPVARSDRRSRPMRHAVDGVAHPTLLPPKGLTGTRASAGRRPPGPVAASGCSWPATRRRGRPRVPRSRTAPCPRSAWGCRPRSTPR